MPVATTVVLGVCVQTRFIAALIAMIAELFGVAMVYPGKYAPGIFVFRLVSRAGKQLLEGWFTAHGRQVGVDQRVKPTWPVYIFAGAGKPSLSQ